MAWSISPGASWVFVFLPALIYYTATRLHSLGLFRSSSYGVVIDTTFLSSSMDNSNNIMDCSKLSNLFYTDKKCTTLTRPVYMVQDGFDNIVATTWKHDEELGRGYLLLSTSASKGLIWQWETGGGPIAIGRTLHLHLSGCRSDLKVNCSSAGDHGSGGIVADVFHEPQRLVVAEWGEGRISRWDPNGARTPLAIQYASSPLLSTNNDRESTEDDEDDGGGGVGLRVQKPFKLLMTPFGDLMILDRVAGVDTLWQLSQATRIPELPSLSASRQAHNWTSLDDASEIPQLLLQSNKLGGMSLVTKQWSKLYITMRQNDLIVVVSLFLEDEDDNDDEEDNEDEAEAEAEEDTKEEQRNLRKRQSTIVLDYTEFASEPGAIEVDEKGNLYLIVDGGVLLVSDGSVVGKISVPNTTLVDLTLGEDKFLYMSSSTMLYRVKVRNGSLKIPTDFVVKGL